MQLHNTSLRKAGSTPASTRPASASVSAMFLPNRSAVSCAWMLFALPPAKCGCSCTAQQLSPALRWQCWHCTVRARLVCCPWSHLCQVTLLPIPQLLSLLQVLSGLCVQLLTCQDHTQLIVVLHECNMRSHSRANTTNGACAALDAYTCSEQHTDFGGCMLIPDETCSTAPAAASCIRQLLNPC